MAQDREIQGESAMMTVLEVMLIFILLLIAPFSFALIEYYRKKDAQQLDINQNYSKDPAYFGNSFMKLLNKSLEHVAERKEGLMEVEISSKKKERLLFFSKGSIIGKDYGDYIVVIDGYSKIEEGDKFISRKEVISFGNLTIRIHTKVRALLVKGGLRVEKPLEITRWMHVEGDCYIMNNSDLGINCYCMGMLHIKARCSFKRIFAKGIIVGMKRKEETLHNDPVYIKGTLRSKEGLNLKVYGRETIIEGNVISDGDIIVEGSVWIKGNIVSNNCVTLMRGCIVGEYGKIKSVVGKKGVKIISNAKIYGYIHTDGEGVIEV